MYEEAPLPTLPEAFDTVARIRERLRAAVKGRDDVIELILIALIADGHVLLEDHPGSGKTTLAKALGAAFEPDEASPYPIFRRIQFTPDLLPSDITGTTVFEPQTGTFRFQPGPVLSHLVLADEINRTSPKVQSAMLEAMGEKQVTVDNQTHALDELFFVIATQNPLDLVGTYPLPTPQLDRFLFKITMAHVAREAELEVLASYPVPTLSRADALPRITRHALLGSRAATRQRVVVSTPIREALVDLAHALRGDPRVLQGGSTRALVLALPALQARALLRRSDHVGPDDLSALAEPIFRHRLELAPGVDDAGAVIRDAVGPVIDALARRGLRG